MQRLASGKPLGAGFGFQLRVHNIISMARKKHVKCLVIVKIMKPSSETQPFISIDECRFPHVMDE